MHKEAGEKRDFLPEFFTHFSETGVEVYLEKGYGEKLGFTKNDYLKQNPNLRFVDIEEIFKKQLIVVIRSPEIDVIKTIKPGSGLMTMLHYETRPLLLKALKEQKIHAFSFDAIVDDENKRQVVSYEMTAYGGVHTTFKKFNELLQKIQPFNRAMKIVIMGMGNLGYQAARFAYQTYNEMNFQAKGVKGISVEFLEKEITSFTDSVAQILSTADVLVDATKRPDATKVIIANKLLGHLPKHAMILDLTADPYEERNSGVQVKAIEGIPHGNIDQQVFDPEEELWNEYISSIPSNVDTTNRRMTISCNAWPSVMPKACMQEYGKKILPYINTLLKNGFDLKEKSKDFYERALYRATIPYFENLER